VEVLVQEVKVEDIVSRWYGCMGGEQARCLDPLPSLLKGVTCLDELARSLEYQESRVPLVKVEGKGLDTQSTNNAESADPQYDLLLNAHLLIATVQSPRQFTIPQRITLVVGVHEIQLHAADLNAPHPQVDSLIVQLDRDKKWGAVLTKGLPYGYLSGLKAGIGGFLPPIWGDTLPEVAHLVEEAYRDERQTNVASFLAVVASEDAKSARVDGQRAMQAELSREVGDWPIGELGVLTGEPEMPVLHIRIQSHDDGIVLAKE
jgi:hypothetical protein